MKIYFRNLTINDAELTQKWRTSTGVSQFQFSDISPTVDQQKQWIRACEKKEDFKHFIICIDDRPIGYQSFTEIDFINKKCSSGNYIYKDEDRLYGGFLHCFIMDYCFYKLKMNKMVNYVLTENTSVIKIQKKLKNRHVGILKEHILKNGVYHDVSIFELIEKDWQTYSKPFNKEQTLSSFD